jgi:threonine/homoserine/homoserine lactone efflux protein
MNIVGFQLYQKLGLAPVLLYLLGVVSVEVFVIYFTLVFAGKLSANKRLFKIISFISIFFLLGLAYVFWAQSKGHAGNHDYISKYIGYAPYWIGVIFNLANFVQLPFWIGWNLYVVNAGYVSVQSRLKYVYIFGTMCGTFSGMLLFILSLNLVIKKSDSISGYLMSHIIPLFFIGFAVFQAWKFYKKYYAASAKK